MTIRLNKLLARRGLGARRKCDALIQSGVVRVNGEVVTEPGTQVEPGRDRVEVRGRPLPPPSATVYYVLHKPVGVITTLDDPEGRRTIRELMPPGPRLFPVGRLDADTSGLLVLTNDGELAHRLMHPRYGVTKTYRVRLDHPPSTGQLERLKTGVEFEPGVVSAPAQVRVVDTTPGRTLVSLTIHEGRYRQVRRMFEALGLDVRGLHRAAYGPLHLGPLPRGMWRELSEEEVAKLRAGSARPHSRPGYRGVPRGGDRAVPRDAERAVPRGGDRPVPRDRRPEQVGRRESPERVELRSSARPARPRLRVRANPPSMAPVRALDLAPRAPVSPGARSNRRPVRRDFSEQRSGAEGQRRPTRRGRFGRLSEEREQRGSPRGSSRRPAEDREQRGSGRGSSRRPAEERGQRGSSRRRSSERSTYSGFSPRGSNERAQRGPARPSPRPDAGQFTPRGGRRGAGRGRRPLNPSGRRRRRG